MSLATVMPPYAMYVRTKITVPGPGPVSEEWLASRKASVRACETIIRNHLAGLEHIVVCIELDTVPVSNRPSWLKGLPMLYDVGRQLVFAGKDVAAELTRVRRSLEASSQHHQVASRPSKAPPPDVTGGYINQLGATQNVGGVAVANVSDWGSLAPTDVSYTASSIPNDGRGKVSEWGAAIDLQCKSTGGKSCSSALSVIPTVGGSFTVIAPQSDAQKVTGEDIERYTRLRELTTPDPAKFTPPDASKIKFGFDDRTDGKKLTPQQVMDLVHPENHNKW